jgi:hypothetical protein
MKICLKCQGCKAHAEFYTNRASFDGFAKYCKPCDKASSRYWASLPKARERKKTYERWQNRTLEGKIKKAYKHAKYAKGAEIDLVELIQWSLTTAYPGMWTRWEKSHYRNSESPCLVRKDPAKGFTLDNLQWVTRAELMSSMRTKETKND